MRRKDFVGASLSILERRLETFFRRQFDEDYFFLTLGLLRDLKPAPVMHAVLAGEWRSTIKHHPLLLENQSYRLWVLCRAFRDELLRDTRLRPEQVSVIPRYALFPVKRRPQPIEWSKPWTAVLAQRSLPGKNPIAAVQLFHELNRLAPAQGRLLICGPRQENSIWLDLMESHGLDTRRIDFRGDLGLNWTARLRMPQKFSIHLSKHYPEDFCVSAAQAQAAGWPLVVTTWLALKDVEGPSIVRVPLAALETPPALRRVARRVFQELARNHDQSLPMIFDVSSPEPISGRTLKRSF
jgi:hypothetical protein